MLSSLIGPLVGPECRRASRRGWIFLARGAAAGISGGVALGIVWWWWVSWMEGADPDFSPFAVLRVALTLLVGVSATIGLVLGPAVVAGGLGGDGQRGSMGLLLTARVNAFEILLARLVGTLSQVLLVQLSTLPPFLFLAFLAGIRPVPVLVMVLYGPALAAGAGGLTAGVAAVSRRSRDALLGSFTLGVGLILLPGLGGWFSWASTLRPLNPFWAIGPLCWEEEPGLAIAAMACWLGLGLVGSILATVRLRSNALRWLSGAVGGRTRRGRWGRGRPIGDRPMLWKEIYIERRNSLGGLGRWFGGFAVAYLILFSLGIGAWYLDALIRLGDPVEADERLAVFQRMIVDPGSFFSVLIQWAVGLRAAVAIAGERERGTWDALLTSPLEGREIVLGKVLGSLHALRWLLLTLLCSWGLALGIGAMTLTEFVHEVAWTAVLSAFMAAVGVRMALTTASAPTVMALTVGGWFAAMAVLSILAGMLVGAIALGLTIVWVAADHYGLSTAPSPWFPMSGKTAFAIIQLALFTGVTVLLVIETRLRFDRLAGRIVPGDAWVEGGPKATPPSVPESQASDQSCGTASMGEPPASAGASAAGRR